MPTIKRRANAAIALYRLGKPDEAIQLLKFVPQPDLRSYVIASIPKAGCDAGHLIAELQSSGVLNSSTLQGILLSLGGLEPLSLAETQRRTLSSELARLVHDDAPAVQSAARWAARSLGLSDFTSRSERASSTNGLITGVNGHQLVLVRPAVFQMGARPMDFEDERDEKRHWRRVNHAYAIATHEVTAGQFRRMRPEYENRWSTTDEHPACIINYYSAAEYCNWLSRLEGIPDSQWCYAPTENGEYRAGMRLVDGAIKRSGYRLPTEAEWELACRARSETKYSFGQSPELLDEYGVTVETNDSRPFPVGSKKPNLFGLFDMHGNVWEWCLDPYQRDYPSGSRTNPATTSTDEIVIKDQSYGVLRGGGSDRLPKQARSTHRWTMAFGRNPETAGFRVVRTVKESY